MRIRVLTGALISVLVLVAIAQPQRAVVHADRVVVLKRERTLQLWSHGKIIKTYKVALGGNPTERRRNKEITKLRKEFMFSTPAMRTASSTNRFTFLIRTRGIGPLRERKECLRVAMFSCMACRTDIERSGRRIG